MAKSLTSIMSQIERLQKEAAAMQSEVVVRIQREIAKFGLTAEQLFGGAPSRKTAKSSKPKSSAARAPKYADGTGNVWGGVGKRPDWLRQALAEGKALDEFLVTKPAVPAPKKRATRKTAKPVEVKVTVARKAAKKRVVAKKAPARKARPRKAAAPAAAA